MLAVAAALPDVVIRLVPYLGKMLKHPAWRLAIGGDFVGFLLQIVALSTGPVVIVQPLVVLMLPVSLIVSATLGWHRPRTGDYSKVQELARNVFAGAQPIAAVN